MGMDAVAHEHELDGRTVFMPGPDHETYVDTYNDIAEGGDTDPVAETTKDDEDPCWEGYTMVGLQDNGDPRCVPDDEVPDADFSESLSPAETKAKAQKGATLNDGARESDKQNSMTDDTGGGGGGDNDTPSVGEVAASVDELRDTVSELKDALPDDGSTDKADGMDDLVDSVAQQFAALDEVERDSAELAEAIRSAVARENDDMMDDDEEEDDDMEDMEESAEKSASGNVEKGHGTGADGAAATGDADAASSGNPLASRKDALDNYGGN
jgi:hypothetical protein